MTLAANRKVVTEDWIDLPTVISATDTPRPNLILMIAKREFPEPVDWGGRGAGRKSWWRRQDVIDWFVGRNTDHQHDAIIAHLEMR